MKKYIIVGVLIITGIAIACSKPEPEKPAAKTEPAKEPAATAPASSHGSSSKDEIPAEIKTAFPDAQTITMQHKDITAGQASAFQKDYGVKLKEGDYHTYVAYGEGSGKRTQLGAATLVDVEGAGEPLQLVVTYNNDIVIKKVTPVKGSGDLVSPAFLDQFSGKNHDQSFQVGKDIKYTGNNKAAAEAVAGTIKRDILSMQALYGKQHSH
jgi:hypothetical protein